MKDDDQLNCSTSRWKEEERFVVTTKVEGMGEKAKVELESWVHEI